MTSPTEGRQTLILGGPQDGQIVTVSRGAFCVRFVDNPGPVTETVPTVAYPIQTLALFGRAVRVLVHPDLLDAHQRWRHTPGDGMSPLDAAAARHLLTPQARELMEQP